MMLTPDQEAKLNAVWGKYALRLVEHGVPDSNYPVIRAICAAWARGGDASDVAHYLDRADSKPDQTYAPLVEEIYHNCGLLWAIHLMGQERAQHIHRNGPGAGGRKRCKH